MLTHALSDSTLLKIRELVEANFAGRDELYAAAETLDDDARSLVCRRLAEHLADHAAELEQILLAAGESGFRAEDVEFIDYVSQRTFLEIVKELHGEAHVLRSIEQCERNLKEKYAGMLETTPEPEAEGILQRQRDQVEFGEHVLHTMHGPGSEGPDSRESADADRS